MSNAGAGLADIESARHAARQAHVPLHVIQPREPALPSLYPSRFTLIRPDQHVAWRGNAWPQDGLGLLRHVTGQSAAH